MVAGDLDVPLKALPSIGGLPPSAGGREWAAGGEHLAGVRAGEQGEGQRVAIPHFMSHGDGE